MKNAILASVALLVGSITFGLFTYEPRPAASAPIPDKAGAPVAVRILPAASVTRPVEWLEEVTVYGELPTMTAPGGTPDEPLRPAVGSSITARTGANHPNPVRHPELAEASSSSSGYRRQ